MFIFFHIYAATFSSKKTQSLQFCTVAHILGYLRLKVNSKELSLHQPERAFSKLCSAFTGACCPTVLPTLISLVKETNLKVLRVAI